MLNPFPQLLIFSFFAPTVLRLAIAMVYAWATWQAITHRKRVSVPFFDKQPWVPQLAAAVELALAAMFFFGWYTQIAAILSLLGAIKYAVLRRLRPQVLDAYFPLSPMATLLLVAIALSLLLSGAGALAFDVPL